MKVSEALAESPFNFYYRQKFDKIVAKAGVGELDLSDDWPEIRRRINSAFSFNIWALLFGPMWAVYRGIPYAFIAVLFLAAAAAAPMFLAVDEKMLRFLPFSIGAMFSLYGNRWLLGSYLSLMRDYGNAGLAEVETRPSVLQVFLAIAIFGIMQVVVDTPATSLRAFAAQIAAQTQVKPDKSAEVAESSDQLGGESSESFWEGARRRWNDQCIPKIQGAGRNAARIMTQGGLNNVPGWDQKAENFCGCIFDQAQSNMTEAEWRAIEEGREPSGTRKKLSYYLMACDSTLEE